MSVLILGDYEDDHAVHILEQLQDQSVETFLLDSADFPCRLQLSFDPKSGDGHLRLDDGRLLNFRQIQSVYWRCYNGVTGPDLPDPDQSYVAENDARSLFESILLTLPARWVNGFEAFRFHQTKGAQLAKVAQLGVRIPETRLTNDPAVVCRFAEQQTSIFKPVQGGAHTRTLSPELLTDSALRRLQLAPITVQEQIPGTNIRVFVIGDCTLACEVRTSAVDFRDDRTAELIAHPLSEEMHRQCLAIAQALHLCWSGIDFRKTPDGQYVFLEANPSPMFLAFEEATGLPITKRLIDLLTSPNGDRQL